MESVSIGSPSKEDSPKMRYASSCAMNGSPASEQPVRRLDGVDGDPGDDRRHEQHEDHAHRRGRPTGGEARDGKRDRGVQRTRHDSGEDDAAERRSVSPNDGPNPPTKYARSMKSIGPAVMRSMTPNTAAALAKR